MTQYDASTAKCLVYSYKEGLLSKIAHDLRHKVTAFTVDLDHNQHLVTAELDARSLRVDCVMKEGSEAPGTLGDDDKRKIEGQIVEDVLHANDFPVIRYQSMSVRENDQGYEVDGMLHLHGVERPVNALARRENGHYVADFKIHQPDFGIKPFSAMMGTLKIRPDLIVHIEVPAA